MPKLKPEQRWREHVLEQFAALEQSGEVSRLRASGLALLGRREPLTSEEWWKTYHDPVVSSQAYREWYKECRKTAERFGLTPWTVEMACLLKGYRPDRQVHVMESNWPRVRVITENTDPIFIARLVYEAQRVGLYVVQSQGSSETTIVAANPVPIAALEPPPKPSSMPPRDSAFRIRVEIPTGYPPEAASKLQKEANRLGKEILRRLGYPVPQRLRASSLVAMADKLRVAETLASGEAYQIIDDIYGEDLTDDQKRRKLVASRRHKVRKRLMKRYETNTVRTLD